MNWLSFFIGFSAEATFNFLILAFLAAAKRGDRDE